MATPFPRTLNSIRSEQDDLAIHLLMYLCILIFMVIAVYGFFFTDMLLSTENYRLHPATRLSETRTSGPPAATREVTAVFPRPYSREFKTGTTGCLEITDPATSNSRQICGKVTGITGDAEAMHIQIDIPLENEQALDIPQSSKTRILVDLPGASLFDSAMERLDLKKRFRDISFHPSIEPAAK